MKLVVRTRLAGTALRRVLGEAADRAVRKAELRRRDSGHPALAGGLPGTSSWRDALRFGGAADGAEGGEAAAIFTEI